MLQDATKTGDLSVVHCPLSLGRNIPLLPLPPLIYDFIAWY
ncbi:hypothetical protein [Dolichospermum sp. UHCC 0315A]|nr:hypothetical protein [Dolichospermum sp. UHCC 0315A]